MHTRMHTYQGQLEQFQYRNEMWKCLIYFWNIEVVIMDVVELE